MTQRIKVHELDPDGAPDGYTPTVSGDKIVLGKPAAAGLPTIDVVADHGAAVDGVTDDTAAWQAALGAAGAAGGARIISSRSGVSIIGGALQDPAGANAQLVLPSIDAYDGEQVSITIAGAQVPPPIMSVVGPTVLPDAHLVLKSTLTAGSGGALLGGQGPAGTLEGFTNVMLRLENVAFRMPANPTHTALNLSKVTGVDIDNVVVDAGSYYIQGIAEPTTASSYGVRLPANNNGAYTRLGAVNVVGFYNGYEFAEHSVGEQVTAWGCKRAFVFVATNHASKFQRLMAVHCQRGAVFTGTHYVDVDQFNIEHAASGWWVTTADIDDPSDFGHGTVIWHVVKANVGIDGTFTVNGGTGLQILRVGAAPAGGGGATVYKGRDRLTATTGDDLLTLGATPVANSPLIWVDGAIKWPGVDYTVTGSEVTFGSPLTAGQVVLVVYDTLTASPQGSTLAATPSPGAISDDFNRANSTTSLGSTSVGGVPWTALRGTWGIASNAAYLAAKVNGVQNLAVVESGAADCTVSFKMTTGGEYLGLFLRATDVSNGYALEVFTGNATIWLYKIVGGTWTMIASAPMGAAAAAGDVYAITMAGSNFTAKRNGATVLTHTDSTHLTQTKHGLYCYGGTGAALPRFDDFTVTA